MACHRAFDGGASSSASFGMGGSKAAGRLGCGVSSMGKEQAHRTPSFNPKQTLQGSADSAQRSPLAQFQRDWKALPQPSWPAIVPAICRGTEAAQMAGTGVQTGYLGNTLDRAHR